MIKPKRKPGRPRKVQLPLPRWQVEVHFVDHTGIEEQRAAELMEVEARTWTDAERAVQEHLREGKTSAGHAVLCEVGGWEALKVRREAQREARQRAEEARRRTREQRLGEERERREELANGFQVHFVQLRVLEDEQFGEDFEVHVVQASGLKDAFAKAADQRNWRDDRTYNFKKFRADRVRIVIGGDVVLDADFPLWQIAMGKFTNSQGEPLEWSAEDDEHLRKSSVRRTETRLRAMREDGGGSALRLHHKRHD